MPVPEEDSRSIKKVTRLARIVDSRDGWVVALCGAVENFCGHIFEERKDEHVFKN